MPLTVTLVRHGQTTKNLEKKIQTRTDALLSELGVLQAEALGRKLADEEFSRVYTSDMTRAINTAELILKFNNKSSERVIVQDPRLRERDFGDWEDHCVTTIHNEATSLGIRMHRLEPPNGENLADFALKCIDFFQEVICKLLESPDTCFEDILIVSHGGWILTLLDALLLHPQKFQVESLIVDETIRTPRNTSATKFTIRKGNENGHAYVVEFLDIFNDEHLRPLEGTVQN